MLKRAAAIVARILVALSCARRRETASIGLVSGVNGHQELCDDPNWGANCLL